MDRAKAQALIAQAAKSETVEASSILTGAVRLTPEGVSEGVKRGLWRIEAGHGEDGSQIVLTSKGKETIGEAQWFDEKGAALLTLRVLPEILEVTGMAAATGDPFRATQGISAWETLVSASAKQCHLVLSHCYIRLDTSAGNRESPARLAPR